MHGRRLAHGGALVHGRRLVSGGELVHGRRLVSGRELAHGRRLAHGGELAPGLRRSAGVQLHITSLPGGRLGGEARRFVDWLAAAGQSWWQVLPLGPPDRYGSPYKSRSAFACWPALLEKPAARVSGEEEADFRERQAYWIEDWCRAAAGRRALRDQVRFEREWLALRAYAARRGVAIIGDLPLYVAPGSVEQRSHPRLFREGIVAGAPPDQFNAGGQLWGNPVYDWSAMRRERYRWWVERQRRAAELYDLVRIDHFRGLVAYWAVPANARSATAGRWRRGPGGAPLLAARRELGTLALIAEDLGVITAPVEELRRWLGVPGMAVLQFLFDLPREVDGRREGKGEGEGGCEDAIRAVDADRVVYTGTHDQDTVLAWWRSLDGVRRGRVRECLRRRAIGLRRGGEQWALMGLAASSRASVAMVQMQDVLGLGPAARMNTPGRAAGNWRWRMERSALTPGLARRLREVAEWSGRV